MGSNSKIRVLDATNDLTFNIDLARAYQRAGVELHVGVPGLMTRHSEFDIVHCHWPEELIGWSMPAKKHSVESALSALDYASGKAFLVCSVHNLIPHGAHSEDALIRKYYSQFMMKMDAIGHFSQTSLEETQKAYPDVPKDRHFLHGMNLFDSMLAHTMTREEARAYLNIPNDEIWVATFGQIRSMDELNLVRRAISTLGSQSPRLLFAGRLPEKLKSSRQIIHRFLHSVWVRKHRVSVMEGYLSDQTTAAVFQAVDAMIILRSGRHLNSGLLPLAATFGTPLVAPDYGIYREFLGGSMNPLYRPAEPASLANALRTVPTLDRNALIKENKFMASDWGCDAIVSRIIQQYNNRA